MSDKETGWTVDTLYEHFTKLLDLKEERDSERFRTQREMTNMALNASDRAVNKAEAAAEKRFEAGNEIKGAMLNQQATFIPRTEAQLSIDAIRDENRIQHDSIREDIKLLKEANIRKSGQGQGLHLGWLMLTGFLGLVVIILTIVSLINK